MVRRSAQPPYREIRQRLSELRATMEYGKGPDEKHDDLGQKVPCVPQNSEINAAPRGHEIRLSFREIRQDSKKGIVFGEAYVPFEPEVGKVYSIEEIQAKVDSWGTFMRAATIEDLAQRFLQFRGYIDRQHDRSTLAGQVVQSFIARTGDPEFTPGAWVMAVKVCPEIWPDVVAGKLTGFSIDVLAARQQHQVLVSGKGVVPDLNGVTQAPYPAHERQVNGETSLRLDELVSVTPFFVSLVDKAAINREFEQRARATANQESEMKTPKTTTAETTAPTEVPVPPSAPDARSSGPVSTATNSTDTRAVKPVKAAPKRTRASRQPQRGEKRFSSDMGDGVIDFAQQWAVEDITDEVCEANWLLHDTLDSILHNAASFADKSAMFDAMVKALNDYAAAMQQTMLQPAVDGEQRSQNLPEHTGRKNAVFHSVPETVVLRSRYTGARVEVRIGAKIAADRLEKIKAAHSSLDEVLKEVEGSVDMPTEVDEPNKDLETSETETIADPNAGSDIHGENSKPAPKPVSTPTDAVEDPSQSGPLPGKVLDADRGEGDGVQPDMSDGTGEQTGETPLEEVAKLVNALIAKIDELSAKVDALDGDASPDQQTGMDDAEDQPRTANQPAIAGDRTMASSKEKTQYADASDEARPTDPNPNNQPVEEGTVPSTTDPSKKGGVTARSKPAMFRQAPWAAPRARGAPAVEDPAAIPDPAAPLAEARAATPVQAAPPNVDPQLAEILATLRSVEKRFDGLDERVAKVEKRRRPSSQPGDASVVMEVVSETRSPVPGINGGPSDGKDLFRGAIFGRRPSGK